MAVEELQFLRRVASRPVKVNVIGALSLYCQTADQFYGDEAHAILALAGALHRQRHLGFRTRPPPAEKPPITNGGFP